MDFSHSSRILTFVFATLIFGSISVNTMGADNIFHARDEAVRARKAGILLIRIEGKQLNSINAMMDGRVAGYQLKPLFAEPMSITSAGRQVVWLLATPDDVKLKSDSSGWDRAHQFVAESRESYQLKGAESVYVEPNIEHMPVTPDAYAAMTTQANVGKPPVSPPWPQPPSFAWHLEAKYSQLKDARKRRGDLGQACIIA